MQFEYVNICRTDAGLLVSLPYRLVGGRQEKRIRPVMDGNCVSNGGRSGNQDARSGNQAGVRDDINRRGAIPDRRSIQKVDRRGDHGGFLEVLQRNLMPQARIWITDGIGVSIDGKRCKIGMFPAVFVHVPTHDQRVQADERHAHIRFVIGIRGRGERCGDLMRVAVGHFLHTHHDSRFQFPRTNRHQGGTECCRAGGTGGLHFDGVPAAQAGPVCHQRTEGALPVDDARHHVADENTFRGLASSVMHGSDNRIGGQVAD